MHKIYIILFIAHLLKKSSNELIVKTNSGPIQSAPGSLDDVEAFLGVPYAEPPIGDLRFAKPVPKPEWKEVYNASSFPPPCIQYSIGEIYFMPDVTNMSEDCLYLNIWIPKKESEHGLRPVIVYIHPGGFSTGSASMKVHDGSHFASRGDVVMVTISYRLGVLGYFLAYTKEADGNMGMYDQIMAIQWVKDNVEYFGGDPENIVLMGTSAGAFSISAHMVSPLSKNLFKRAIVQAGSVFHPFFADNNARLLKNSEIVASVVGCTNETFNISSNPQSVVKCLKDKPKEDLVEAELLLLKTNPITFYPRVNDEFLPKDTISLLREGKFRKETDVLTGITEDEGTIMLTLGLSDYLGLYGKNSMHSFNKFRFAAIARGMVMLAGQSNASEVIDFYNKNVKNRTTVGYTKMAANLLGDFGIDCNTLFLADILSLKGNHVFFYKFGFRAASTPTAEWMGTTHLDEEQYVFGNPYHANFSAKEEELSRGMIDRWSAFARSGNPNIPGHIPWLRYSYHNPLYLYFGQDEESIRQKPLDRCEFWRKRFNSSFDSDLIRFLRNSGMNTAETNAF